MLTDPGRSLRPVVVTPAAWGNARLDPEGRSGVLVDARTGRLVTPVVVDEATGERLDDSEKFVFAAGPSASPAMRGRYEGRRTAG